jgi:hypothetical protein
MRSPDLKRGGGILGLRSPGGYRIPFLPNPATLVCTDPQSVSTAAQGRKMDTDEALARQLQAPLRLVFRRNNDEPWTLESKALCTRIT